MQLSLFLLANLQYLFYLVVGQEKEKENSGRYTGICKKASELKLNVFFYTIKEHEAYSDLWKDTRLRNASFLNMMNLNVVSHREKTNLVTAF